MIDVGARCDAAIDVVLGLIHRLFARADPEKYVALGFV